MADAKAHLKRINTEVRRFIEHGHADEQLTLNALTEVFDGISKINAYISVTNGQKEKENQRPAISVQQKGKAGDPAKGHSAISGQQSAKEKSKISKEEKRQEKESHHEDLKKRHEAKIDRKT